LQIPLVAHLHNVHDRESRLMGVADRVIAVSAAVCEDMQRRGIPAKKLRVVLNGTLNSPRTKPLGKIAPQPLARPAITSVAGLYERKGITELIEAFASLASDFPAAHLYLVGDGPIRSQLEAQAAATAAGARIHFTGFQSQPQSYMLASDIFVLASRRESFGLVLTEARQAGCAIVATLVDGIPEALDGGGAGLLVPPRDVPALTAALRSLLSDRTLAQSLSARAQQGLERFTTATMARDVEKIYRELLRRDS
jgi:glycosyltransferase involved in cell wall biosynthesis